MPFPKPPVGSTISVTTRYPNYYYYSDAEYQYYRRENVKVLPPEPWLKADQFKITSDEARMPFRVLHLDHVCELEINGQAQQSIVNTTSYTVDINGSKGNVYTVTIKNGSAVSCTCKGFQFRNSCRHLKTALG